MMAGDRKTSPSGDRRERSVPCTYCHRPTMNIDATCDACYERRRPQEEEIR